MRRGLRLLACSVLLVSFGPGCGRDGVAAADKATSASGSGSPAATAGLPAPAPSAAAPSTDCGHSVCTDNLFIDAAAVPGCTAGAVCTVHLTLVATGDFHVNDEYPYRFKAEDAAGVTYLGSDEGGKNVFSKGAGDWTKIDARSGAMTVKFTPERRGSAAVAGVLKLSVCSGATCQLEQSHVSALVRVD
jgi:hypothetical protein